MKFPSYFISAVCGSICIPLFVILSRTISVGLNNSGLGAFMIVMLPWLFTSVDLNAWKVSYQKSGSFFRMKFDISFFLHTWFRMLVFLFCGGVVVFVLNVLKVMLRELTFIN